MKLIDKPGIYDLSMAQYHSQPCVAPSISSSGLRTIFNKSPAHYWVNSSLNPDCEPQAETEAFSLGRAAHHLLLGEADFSTLFVVRPEKAPDGRDWNGNNLTCKKWIADQQNEGRTVLKIEQINQIRGMARSLAKHPLVQSGILNGDIERSLVWRDEETGMFLKARPDAIPNDSGDFADLKTTISVDGLDLMRTIADYAYHQQAALVADGWQAITGKPIASFTLVFVEKTAPFCTRLVTLKDCDLQRGRLQNRAALRIFAACVESGEWPGPGSDDAEYMELPTWAQARIDSQLTYLEQTTKAATPPPKHSPAEYMAAG